MEKKMENEMETGLYRVFCCFFLNCKLPGPQVWGLGCRV